MDKYPVGLCQAPVDLGAVLCHPFLLLRTPTAAGRRTRTGLFLCNFYCLFIESLLTSSFICWFSILPVKDGNSLSHNVNTSKITGVRFVLTLGKSGDKEGKRRCYTFLFLDLIVVDRCVDMQQCW